MRDDEMISAGYPFKCVTLHDDEKYVCYLSEHDKIQYVVSKFIESIMGDKSEPSKDYGARIVHRGNPLGPVDEIYPISSKKFANNVILHITKKNKRSSKLLLKSIELPQENSKKIASVDVEDENDVKNTLSNQRLDFKLVKDHIESHVMSTISVKSTNPIELEKLCLLKSKIAEIELLFK